MSIRWCARPPGGAEAGSGGWCAAQIWLGWAAQVSADLAAALGHFTAVRDAIAGRPPSRALTRALAGRADILRLMGRTAEAGGDARRSLALARQIGDPVGELQALAELSFHADYAGDHAEAVRLARQAGQVAAGTPGSLARRCSYLVTSVLADAGDLAEAARAGAAGLARARDAGDLWNQANLLPRVADLDLRSGRTGDAAAHLREGLHLAVRTGNWFELLTGLSQCGNLCAATGRAAEALTLWAACVAVGQPERGTNPPWFVPRSAEQLRQARQALGPGRARAAEDRGAAMSITTAAEYALMLTDPGRAAAGGAGLWAAQRPGTGAGYPGRPGPHQRADRRAAVHQRPHGRLAPGPDPGQDRLPPPRRPDPAGAGRRPGLARPARPPGAPRVIRPGRRRRAKRGQSTPAPRTAR